MHVWNDLFFILLIPLLPAIKEDLGLSFTEVVLLKSVFSGASAVLQVPAGFLAEGIGEFWLIIWGNIWVAAGLLGMALSPIFALLIAASFLGGLGGGAQHPLGSSMVSRAYDDRGRSTAVGTVNFAGDLGKMAGPVVAGTVALYYGWRTVLGAVGVAGIVFMVLAMMARRSVDIGRPQRHGSEATSGVSGQTPRRGFVALSGIGFLDSAARGAALAFLPFVMDAKDMSATHISIMLFLLFAGGAAGKFVCGWLGERHGTVSLIWGTKGLTATLLVLSIVTPATLLGPLMVALGLGLNGTSSVLYAGVAELVPPIRRARLYGIYYTTNEGGTVLAPVAYGIIADLFSVNVTVIVMGLLTATILPASLMLRKYLAPKAVASRGTEA